MRMSDPSPPEPKADIPAGRRLAALLALASVWLTTAGHTACFREMDAARGWVTTDGYAMHSSYLFTIACGLVLTWANRPLGSPARVMRYGLVMLVVGSLVNGLLLEAPYRVFLASRMVAGFGAGMVLAAAPVAGQAAGSRWFAWAGILLPSIGVLVIAWAADLYREHGWDGGFLFEGLLAFSALLTLLLWGHDHGKTGLPHVPLWSLPFVGFLGGLWYTLSYGQLLGWWEDPRTAGAMITCLVMLALVIASGVLQPDALPMAGWPTLLVAAFAGFVQYFNVSDMGVYGGMLLDLGMIDRSLLIWPLSIGAACAAILAMVLPNARWLTLAGLLAVSLGMWLAHLRTMEWPFWSALNQVQFNWFPAPGIWELAPARFLMGFGASLTLIGLQRVSLTVPSHEALRRDLLTLFQFMGGAASIGVLTLCTTRGYQNEYSFVAERGYIQPESYIEYGGILKNHLHAQGFANPEAGARSLLHGSVVYESNNLVFASIYGGFLVAALVFSGLVLSGWIWRWLKPVHRQPA